ncbi:AlpA family phage regulatory protein [Brachymonas sp. G13]|uniref:helix-turn-helix transcriptional regulator n=1 Tax=Brachymonas wangyanguii TaxID=3130163 RepID=UPI00307EBF00
MHPLTSAPELKSAILRYPEVAVLLNISQESLYRWQRVGLFPKPVKYGPRCVGWPREVVEQWLADKRAAQAADQ